MHKEALYAETAQILKDIKEVEILEKFYLAGGTALALQLGHRKSIDLDLFSPDFPKNDLIKQAFHDHDLSLVHEEKGTLDFMVNNVKVSFLEYKYPLIQPLVAFDHIKMAQVLDLACMKITAISSRGSKKDFVDLYFILKDHSLEELFEVFEKKYRGVKYQKLHMLKSLMFFDDADKDPDPDYLIKTDWVNIKNELTSKLMDYVSVQS